MLQQAASYVWTAGVATATQLLVLLGPGLLLALVMHILAGFVETRAIRILGRGLYLGLFGWLGTSVHECGHALFCVIFRHRIVEMKLFDPDPDSGALGYVKHAWNSKNPYQRVGRFFIGVGPIILGTMVIYAATWLLLGSDVTSTMDAVRPSSNAPAAGASLAQFTETVPLAVRALLSQLWIAHENVGWRFYVFLYIVFTVGSSVRLSRSDIRGAASGLVVLVGLLLLFNVATGWMGGVSSQLLSLSHLFAVFYTAMALALALHAMLALVLFALSLLGFAG